MHIKHIELSNFRKLLAIRIDLTANIFHMIHDLAIDAIEGGHEQITDDAIERWQPELDVEAAFA